MKSRWLSGPYILWMALFTLIPLGIVVYIPFTDGAGGFNQAKLARHGD